MNKISKNDMLYAKLCDGSVCDYGMVRFIVGRRIHIAWGEYEEGRGYDSYGSLSYAEAEEEYTTELKESGMGKKIVKDVDGKIEVEEMVAAIDLVSSEAQSGHALKFDTDKVRMELLSVDFLTEVSKVLTFGAEKYADNNWRNGFEWSRLYGAALRHLTSHMNGDNLDEESGLSHLSHAACCLMFLIEHEQRQIGTDDRYTHPTKEHEVTINEEIAKKMREASDAECESCSGIVEEGIQYCEICCDDVY